jgi:hypothetical protein
MSHCSIQLGEMVNSVHHYSFLLGCSTEHDCRDFSWVQLLLAAIGNAPCLIMCVVQVFRVVWSTSYHVPWRRIQFLHSPQPYNTHAMYG